MKPTCFRSDRQGVCCQCRGIIYTGDDVAFMSQMVRTGRDGSGRVWEKQAWKVRHWICPVNTRAAAFARAEQLSGLMAVRDEHPSPVLDDMILAIQSAG